MTALIIAGFHRSGTSVLAQLLDRAGLFLGDRLLAAGPHNRRGHFEDLEVIALHDRILGDGGRTWQVAEPFLPYVAPDLWEDLEALVARRGAAHEVWGFKDPRVCHFLSLWKHLVPDAKILMTFRSPEACVHSLERRHARDLAEGVGPAGEHLRFWREPGHAARMWVAAHRALLRAHRVYRDDTMLVSFDDLARNANVVGALNRRWGLGLREVPPAAVFDAPLLTSARPSRVAEPEVGDEAGDLFETFRSLRREHTDLPGDGS